MKEANLITYCRQKMKKGSKSFFLANLLFPNKTRDHVFLLYSWCRYCDNQVDEAPDLATGKVRLEKLRQETIDAYHGIFHQPIMEAFYHIFSTYQIPL